MKKINRYKLLGPAIGALGAAAGGALGKMLMGEPSPLKVDTSIPGVTSATVQKKSKQNDAIKVAQVDPTQALNYFQQAATSSENYYMKGLDLYGSAIDAATKQIGAGYALSNATLAPQAQAGLAALNKQLQFMGLAPISQSVGLSAAAGTIGNAALEKQMADAENIQDPAKRADAKQQILNTINSMKQNTDFGAAPTVYQAQPLNLNNGIANGRTYTKSERDAYNAQEQAKAAASQQAYDEWAAKQSSVPGLVAKNDALTQLASQFNSSYSGEYQRQLTSDEIGQELEKTPGYQFAFDQGLQALDRSASAKGRLNSGNSELAAVQFGKDLASTTFQQALANLASIASQGLPANTQIAANQVNEANTKANLTSTLGAAAANTYNAIGNQYASSYTNAGQTAYNASVFNANAQNTALAAKRAQDSAERQQAVASGAGYMNAMTAQNQFQYGVFQNQQGGSAFYGATPTSYNILPIGGTTGSAGNPAASYGIMV